MPKSSLDQYKNLHEMCDYWMTGDNPHSILSTLSECIHYRFIYETVNESSRIGALSEENSLSKNGYFVNFIRDLYYNNQSLCVRRLTDPWKDSEARRSISLRGILENYKNNQKLLTRENYICHDGVKFDYSDNDGGAAFSCLVRHKQFDKICIKNKKGERQDEISCNWIENLISCLSSEVIIKVRNYVNNIVAHSGSRVFATRTSLHDFNIMIEDINEAFDTIVHVFKEVAVFLLQKDISVRDDYMLEEFMDNFSHQWLPEDKMDDLKDVMKLKLKEIHQ